MNDIQVTKSTDYYHKVSPFPLENFHTEIFHFLPILYCTFSLISSIEQNCLVTCASPSFFERMWVKIPHSGIVGILFLFSVSHAHSYCTNKIVLIDFKAAY
ncbi:hypothetical protein NE237_002758 [Protea cynaroides]|uniref:Uncharacterized protein n=1 Tax=Protea cynaroides TaxID=273540 RepID=A0A9Q0QS38_9MAGN|nr:hypothetical protein NE237_002758 [Protea cynaroides]